MKNRNRSSLFVGGKKWLCRTSILSIISFIVSVSLVNADLGPENVLILVNEDSATSRYIAKMYREYYPAITDVQVLELEDLPDCSGPASTAADEIITRDVYNSCIAGPVREHLLGHHLIEQIMVIVTTAGMPYRIEDTVHDDVIYPAGSNYNRVSQFCGQIDAASVESELTCLWYADPFGLANRIVNPYQGYRNSSITLFERLAPGSKPMQWEQAITSGDTPPKMEGEMPFTWPPSYGTINRNMHPGDIYLTCRLDGPKSEGESAIFAVRNMLERSKRASDPSCGVNALNSVIVIDDCPGKTLDLNRVYNLDGSMNYYIYNPGLKQPPDAPTVLSMDDYTDTFNCLTSGTPIQPGILNAGSFDAAYDMQVLLDNRSGHQTNQNDLGPGMGPVYFCCFGKNGDESCTPDYLTTGLEGGPLLLPTNGAVFSSIESFNALTLFSGVQTVPVSQGKIVDFITIGGTGAIGHAFEPMSSAAVANTFVAYNLFADSDMDNRADLSFVEAAWSGIPFLSWAEVVIGDPLMRIAYGPGEDRAWRPFTGDINGDDKVNFFDVLKVRIADGSVLYSDDDNKYSNYNDLCDINQDGKVNFFDVLQVRIKDGTSK